MFFKPINVLPEKKCLKIISTVSKKNDWIQGWLLEDNCVFRSDLVNNFYEDQIWNYIKLTVTSSKEFPVDWIYSPFCISKYAKNTALANHKDVMQKKRNSIRSRVILINLGTIIDISVKDFKISLFRGQGIQFPIETMYGVPTTKTESWLLTTWGMRYFN